MKDFKLELKEHLLTFQTSPYLFIGSGLSRRYLNLPTWLNFLDEFSKNLKLDKPFEYYQSTTNGHLPLLASKISEEFHETWWSDNNFEESRNNNKENSSVDINSPFKIEIAKFIETKLKVNSIYLNEIELLKRCVIDGIITTNWDTFLNDTFPEFTSYIGQEELMFSNSFSIGELFKIHGCTSKPNSIVVTEKDYTDFSLKQAYLASKLLTIFVEHPIVFIGYSISDSNINEILNKIVSCVDNVSISKLKDRLIFIEWSVEKIEPKLNDGNIVLQDKRVLPIKQIKLHDFSDLFIVLSTLKKRLPIKILKNFKESVFEFVQSNKTTNKMYIGDLTDLSDNQEIEFVVGVGIAQSFSDQGYKAIKTDDLIEDVLLDNKKYDSNKLICQTLPELIQSNKIFLPVYKYLRKSKNIDSKAKLLVSNSIDNKIIALMKGDNQENYYPAPSYAKKKIEIRKKFSSVNAIVNEYDTIHSLYYIPLLDKSKIDLLELSKFLKSILKKEPALVKNTMFKKIVCLYDYLKFGLN
jgi:hypothetical protein